MHNKNSLNKIYVYIISCGLRFSFPSCRRHFPLENHHKQQCTCWYLIITSHRKMNPIFSSPMSRRFVFHFYMGVLSFRLSVVMVTLNRQNIIRKSFFFTQQRFMLYVLYNFSVIHNIMQMQIYTKTLNNESDTTHIIHKTNNKIFMYSQL